MDKLTIKKIITINCEKIFGQRNSKEILKKYNEFLEQVNTNYLLNVTHQLSIGETPIISIFDTKQKELLTVYLFVCNNSFYLKTPIETFIVSTIEEVLNLIDNYFYN